MTRVVVATTNTIRGKDTGGNDNVRLQHILDGGAERLVYEWRRQRQLALGATFIRSVAPPINPAYLNLALQAGSARFHDMGIQLDLSPQEYNLMRYQYAPIESDGWDDENEWSLFTTYLDGLLPRLNDRHHLSSVLRRWEADVVSLPQYFSSYYPMAIWEQPSGS